MAPLMSTVTASWDGDLRFVGGVPGGPTTVHDGNGKAAPSPVSHLLLAAATCGGADVVEILKKMRVELREFRIDVQAVRREEYPRRVLSLHFDYHIVGDGVDETKARRAIDLSHEKYCSVLHSLAPDIPITYGLTLG